MNSSRPSLDSALTPERLADIKRGAPSVRDRARQTMQDAGLVLTGSEQERLSKATPYRPRALYADPRTISPRWPYAVMRIKRILEGAQESSSIESAVRGAEHSTLAQEYAETWIYYMTRTRPPPAAPRVDHNPFRHLSDYDAMRKFVRYVEDVCDRSTGRLGSWCTK